MLAPNIAFRPNPHRAIYLQGEINQQLVDRLTPQIISLQSAARAPITVYIDSPGGRIDLMEALLKLLTAASQDSTDPCRIITVVTSTAASAAADMLSSGDYALAYPGSTVLFHGSRFLQWERPLTVEWTSLLAQHLRETNDSHARELARRIEDRLMFRFIISKRTFDKVRKIRQEQMTDFECFLAMISYNLSGGAQRVLDNAKARYERYDALLRSVIQKRSTAVGKKTQSELEAIYIKAIVDFEVRTNKNKRNWSFETSGLNSLMDDFFLLNEYLKTSESDRFKAFCTRYGNFLIADSDRAEISSATPEEQTRLLTDKVRPQLQPIWSFFVALCQSLQQGENVLTATDAYWLGLIDEVIGAHDLPCLRLASEYKPEEQEKAVPASAAA